MSQAGDGYTKEDIQKIVEAEPFKVTNLFRYVLICLAIIGLFAFLEGYVNGGQKRLDAWIALHVNFIYWFSLAAASTGFAAVFHICNAQWARPIRRIFESAYPFLMVSPLFILILYFGADDLFEWATHPVHGKEAWLTTPFLHIRDFMAACLLFVCLSVVIRCSLSIDLTAIRRGLVEISKDKPASSRWNQDELSAFEDNNESSPEKSIIKLYNRMGVFSPICVIVYALAMSLLAFDQLMSVDPHWYSTLYGGLYFMSAVYLAVAFVCISIFFVINKHPLLRSAIKRKTLHDIGKLLFGFGIFWAYMFWSHYLPIWYGNLPEETGFIILRLREYPWRNVAWLVLGMCFIVPFFLGLSRDLKQVPVLLAMTGIIVAIGLWIQYYLLFAPGHYPDVVSINFRDVLIGLGFLGLFVLGVISYLYKYPLIPFGDLLVDTSENSED